MLALKIAGAASVGALVACSDSVPDRSSEAIPSTPSTPSATITATPTPTVMKPRIEKKTIVEIRTIPFKKKTVKDSSLAKGKTDIRTRGVTGKKRLTYELTYANGVQTGKRLVREVITTRPINQVTAIGTRVEPQPASECDPNYSGACVPIASDVDCAGGSGNGPAYVRGPVRVVGTDIYDLDRDSNGIGCEA
jgi:hypothetical protein